LQSPVHHSKVKLNQKVYIQLYGYSKFEPVIKFFKGREGAMKARKGVWASYLLRSAANKHMQPIAKSATFLCIRSHSLSHKKLPLLATADANR